VEEKQFMRNISNNDGNRITGFKKRLYIGPIEVVILSLIWGVSLSIGLSTAWGQTDISTEPSVETIRVVGKGVKSDQDPDPAIARDTAITNGLNKAVVQVALTIVPPEPLNPHFEALISLLDQQT
jgi:hypothetical protein